MNRGPRHPNPAAPPAPSTLQYPRALSQAQVAGLRFCGQHANTIRETTVTGGAPTMLTLRSLFDRKLITLASRAAELTPAGRAVLREFSAPRPSEVLR